MVKKAISGRTIVAIDGCPLHCVKHCLALHGVEPTWHYTLTELGLKKRLRVDCLAGDARRIKAIIVDVLKSHVRGESTP